MARRHAPAPAILVIDAEAAHAEGVRFYESGPLFLAEKRAGEVSVPALVVNPFGWFATRPSDPMSNNS